MKGYWYLAAFGCVCLSVAAVWLGGLNQDEGWYLYAANLVREGQRVYRDFAFTQGPVMPTVYSAFAWIWAKWGLLGARVFTLGIGWVGIAFAALAARRMAPEGRGAAAALMVAMLLGCNLYHLYYLAIPKTYALAALFVSAGMWCVASRDLGAVSRVSYFVGGLLLALAAGVRISLGMLLAAVGLVLLTATVRGRLEPLRVFAFGLGGVVGLMLSYGAVVLDAGAMRGLLAAQAYHAARGGFDVTWVVGSVSRLVRWYLPVFIVLGLGVGRAARHLKAHVFGVGFLAVFVLQMLAPFPYEDYQVPIMGLLTVFAVVLFLESDAFKSPSESTGLLLVLGLTYACSFGSPLLEKWKTNGQDRFWSLKKETCELAQLRDVARKIEAVDPNGTEIFTQDLYLAIETNRKVPKGLEMGPFSILTDDAWRRLIMSVPCAVAAISGYTFAIDPPRCNERPISQQFEFLKLLKEQYAVVETVPHFGQNATTLLLLKRK